MSKWERVKLGDVCDIERGGSPRPIDDFITDDNNGLNWIKIGDTSEDSKYITQTKQKIIPAGLKKSRYVQPGDFLLTNSMSFGRPYILKIDGCIHDGWLVLRDKGNYFHKEYLYYALSSKPTYAKFKMLAVGGVVNNLNSSIVKQVEFPLPSYEVQVNIARILDNTNDLLSVRKQQFAELDNLIKSTFYEMFGDPAKNDKEWNTGKISDLASSISYGTSQKASTERLSYSVLRMNNITYQGDWNFSDLKYVDLSEKDQKKYLVYKGDLLFNRTNSKELVGKTAVYRENTPRAFAGYLVRLVPNERANSEFIAAFLNSSYGKKLLLKMAKNIVGMANINATEMSNIDIYIPPLELQNRFAEIVAKIEEQKALVKQAIDETQLLFDSLMSQYFDE